MKSFVDEGTLLKLIGEIKSGTDKKRLENILKQKSDSEKLSSLGKFTENVHLKNQGETAYQRAIFAGKNSELQTIGSVKWLDLELPVIFGAASRRSSLDLIGKTKADNKIILCELKYANPSTNSKSNSPTYALLELLVYYFYIQINAKKLATVGISHANKVVGTWDWTLCNDPKNIILAVTANHKYWSWWLDDKRKTNTLNEVEEIRKYLPTELIVKFFSTEDPSPCFTEQAKKLDKSGRYKPLPLNGNWTEKLNADDQAGGLSCLKV